VLLRKEGFPRHGYVTIVIGLGIWLLIAPMRRRATIAGSLGIWHGTAWIVLSVIVAANQVTLHGIVPFLLEHPLLSGADLPAALIQVKWSATTAIKEATKARNASRLWFAIIVVVEDILLLNVHQPLLFLEEEEDHDVGDQFCTVFRK
jgi:hypothetical protein